MHKFNKLKTLLNFLLLILSCMKILELGFPRELYHMWSLELEKLYLPRSVANSTSATFLHVFGSELIQKYLGDGPKLVRELFRVADELSPSIVFIDEIEALGRPLVLTPCRIGISPVYRVIFQLFSHIISKR
ncbi:unnamed protein product [Musa acuminata var. zebrina]